MIVFVFVLLFPADAVLISRALLPYGLPCARGGFGSTDLLGWEGGPFGSGSRHLLLTSTILGGFGSISTTFGFLFLLPTTLRTQEAGHVPAQEKRAGPLVRRGQLGTHSERLRGSISPQCRGGERVLPLGNPSVSAPGSRVVGSAPSHSLPGRSRDGSIPFGMRRGGPRAHSPPRAFAPRPRRISPGRRPWGDGAGCLLMLSG